MLIKQTTKFEAAQASINNRIAIVTASDAPDEAVEALRKPMESLRKLELGHLYIELLQEVEDLTVQARKPLPGNPKEALIPYTRLREISRALTAVQKTTDGAAAHLVDFVDGRAASLWADMQHIMSEQFRAVLKGMSDPLEQLDPTAPFVENFEKLLDLQAPEFVSPEKSIILLPFVVMTEDTRTRFRYHFMGDRETNNKENVRRS